jgi:hypothetical protein
MGVQVMMHFLYAAEIFGVDRSSKGGKIECIIGSHSGWCEATNFSKRNTGFKRLASGCGELTIYWKYSVFRRTSQTTKTVAAVFISSSGKVSLTEGWRDLSSSF